MPLSSTTPSTPPHRLLPATSKLQTKVERNIQTRYIRPGTLRGDVNPTGTKQTIHGVPTYVARPNLDPDHEPLGTVVIIADAFG
jgi:hypothetical protein